MTPQLLYKNPRQRALEAAWRMDNLRGVFGGYANEEARQNDYEIFTSYFGGIFIEGFQHTNQLLKGN